MPLVRRRRRRHCRQIRPRATRSSSRSRPASTSTGCPGGDGQGAAVIRPDGSSAAKGALADVSPRAMVGTAMVHGMPGRAVRVELPRRIDLYSVSGGQISVDDVVSDLPSLPRLDSAGNLTFRFGGRVTDQRRCRRRISRRHADHRRISVNGPVARMRTNSIRSGEKPNRPLTNALEGSRKRAGLIAAPRVTGLASGSRILNQWGNSQ